MTSVTLQENGSPIGSLDATSANYIAKQVPDVASAQTIGSTNAPAYMYKFFRTTLSSSFATGSLSISSSLTIENIADNGIDYASGAETVDTSNGHYISTITGNKDAASARTPFILAQDSTQLFRIHMRGDGIGTNHHYAVIRVV